MKVFVSRRLLEEAGWSDLWPGKGRDWYLCDGCLGMIRQSMPAIETVFRSGYVDDRPGFFLFLFCLGCRAVSNDAAAAKARFEEAVEEHRKSYLTVLSEADKMTLDGTRVRAHYRRRLQAAAREQWSVREIAAAADMSEAQVLAELDRKPRPYRYMGG